MSTPTEDTQSILYDLHQTWLNLAKEAFLKFDQHERDFSAVTLPLPLKLLPHLKEKISHFREELLEEATKAGPKYDKVFQLNIQLFPVTKATK